MQMSNYLFFRHYREQALNFYAQSNLGRAALVMRHGPEV